MSGSTMGRPTTEWTGEERRDYAMRLEGLASRLQRAADQLERGTADARPAITLAMAVAGVMATRWQDESVAP